MWLSKKAYQALVTRLGDIEGSVKSIRSPWSPDEARAMVSDSIARSKRVEEGLDKLIQSHAALKKEVGENLYVMLGPEGMVSKKLDIVSGQLVRIEKALPRKKGK